MKSTVPESATFVRYSAHTEAMCMKAMSLLTELSKTTMVLDGDDVRLLPTMVPIVTTKVFDYPSRFLRILPHDASPDSRAYRDRQKVLARMPWLSGASYIICLHPDRDPESPDFVQAIMQLFVAKHRPRKRQKSREFLQQRRMQRAHEQRIEMGLASA